MCSFSYGFEHCTFYNCASHFFLPKAGDINSLNLLVLFEEYNLNILGEGSNYLYFSIYEEICNIKSVSLCYRPNCVDWMLCLPYYQMSGLSPVDVVRQAVQYKQHSKQVETVMYC